MLFLYLLLGCGVALAAATQLAPDLVTRWALFGERSFSGLRLRQAQVDGFCIPYLEGGKGDTLLLVHGFAGDKDNFTRIARFLTPHYHVIIPDLPGFGDASRDMAASYRMADQVQRLHALLGQLGVTRVHLGGNSMGGFISAQFVASYPGMVASVWLLDAAGTAAAHDTPVFHQYLATGEMPLLLREASQFNALLAATTHKPPFLPRFVRGVLARRAEADYPLHKMILAQLVDSPLMEAGGQQFATPAFIVWGACDQLLNPNGLDAYKALFTGAQTRLMPGIGHLPMVEAPRQSAQDYLAFRRALV
jgi:pimeloyl-ACP methyl ester carboxylesterase